MNIFDRLMSPLSKDHCMLFYVMGLLGLFFALIQVIVIIRGLLNLFIFRRKAAKNVNTKATGLVLGLFSISFFYFVIVYFINRIGYSMCIASLR